MTTAELAARLELDVDVMRAILEEARAGGIVEPSPSGWRLTAAAREAYAEALLGLFLGVEDSSRAARHRLEGGAWEAAA